MNKILIAIFLCLFSTEVLSASEHMYNSYFVKYGKKYNIPPELLWGIAKTESDFQPMAINVNTNGSFDIGIMQINSSHKQWLETQNISLEDLYDPKINIAVGAKILSNCIKKFGFTYQGLNCYNSGFNKVDINKYNVRVINNIKSNRLALQKKRLALVK